eukprot:scaffold4262_cov169-Amphora_coffeaeformis.AAC.10
MPHARAPNAKEKAPCTTKHSFATMRTKCQRYDILGIAFSIGASLLWTIGKILTHSSKAFA